MTARKFSLQISKETAEAIGDLNLGVRRISLDALSRVIVRSPVDKGRFKANWFVSIGEAGTDTTEETDKSPKGTRGTISYNRGNAVIGGYKNQKGFPSIVLYNNLPYAGRLEDNHSTQTDGLGIIAITVTELQAGL